MPQPSETPLPRRTLLLGTLGAVAGAAFAEEPPFALAKARRIMFLGDSITAAGMYVQYFEGYLLTRFPHKRFEIFSLGLPSETVTGLSEPDHPWPRPNVHERLGRALERLKPDTVVACYGMNDGI
jgi:lysophospholipase L1-like esterase